MPDELGAKMSALHTGGRPKVAAWSVALVVGALGAMVWSAPAAAPDTVAARVQPKAAPMGTYAVGRVEQTFVDDSRPTKAKQGFEGAPNRTLHTTIYYPARGKAGESVTPDATPDRKRGPYPMILYSHGNNSFGTEYEPLLRQWASAGYVVAAPDYPLSNQNGPGDADPSDVENQPADARFVIDRALASSSKRSGALSHLVDAKRIAASGHSLGAITTYRLVYQACCRDRRVTAAATMSGVAGDVPEYFTGISTPLLAEHGDADGTIRYQAGADAFAKASPPKFFLTLVGGGHTPPYRGGPDAQPTTVAHVTLDFFDRYLKNDRGALEQLRQDANQPGVATLQEQVR
jgi:dienelactone hydrolase